MFYMEVEVVPQLKQYHSDRPSKCTTNETLPLRLEPGAGPGERAGGGHCLPDGLLP